MRDDQGAQVSDVLPLGAQVSEGAHFEEAWLSNDYNFHRRPFLVILSPLKNVDRDLIGSRPGNSFERKFSLLMHVDACKAQEIVEKHRRPFFGPDLALERARLPK